MNWRFLLRRVQAPLAAVAGLCLGWLGGVFQDNPPRVAVVVVVILGVLVISAFLAVTLHLERHRFRGARGKGGLAVLDEGPLMPDDGNFGWSAKVMGTTEPLQCFRVLADEDIGRESCQWQDSSGKRGEALFAPVPRRPNARIFCIASEEPDIATLAEVRLYARKEIRLVEVRPVDEPPGLLERYYMMTGRLLTRISAGEPIMTEGGVRPARRK